MQEHGQHNGEGVRRLPQNDAKRGRLVSVSGSVLLLAAPFAPFISSSGTALTVLGVRPTAAYILIAFGMIAFFSAVFGSTWLGWFSGFAGVNAAGQVFLYQANTLPSRLAEWHVLGVGTGLEASDFRPDYGVVIIILGIGLSFVGAYRRPRFDS
jgi:hypothetical protein